MLVTAEFVHPLLIPVADAFSVGAGGVSAIAQLPLPGEFVLFLRAFRPFLECVEDELFEHKALRPELLPLALSAKVDLK
jgi:hypothetical protein